MTEKQIIPPRTTIDNFERSNHCALEKPSTILEVNVNVDKDGGSPSPVGGGVLHSNKSEVRLRKGEVTEE